MKKWVSLFLCLILLTGMLPMAAPARAAGAAVTVTSIKANKTSAVTGESITWTAAATGGTGTLQYYFRIYRDGTLVKKGSYGTARTFTYTPAAAGSYKAKVYVKDAADTKASKVSGAVAVTAAITVTSIKANKTSAAVNEPITWTAAASGGSGTLQYYFRVYKDGSLITTRSYSTAKTFTYTPTEAGTYKAKVYVKDPAGTKVSKLSTAVAVTNTITITGMKANKTSAVVGEPITWTAAATGGSGTLQYYFIVYKDGTRIQTRAYSTARTFTYTPAASGTYKAQVYVKDAAGTKVSKLSAAVTVRGASLFPAEYGLVTYVYQGVDDWGAAAYYAQIVLGDGSIINRLPITRATYDSVLTGTVYKLISSGGQWTLAAPGGEVRTEAYNTGISSINYNSANYIQYSGYASSLAVQVNQRTPDATAAVITLSAVEQTSSGSVRRVYAVWFSSSAVPISSNFIYVAGTEPVSSRLVDGRIVNYYEGYLNGVRMADLATASAPAKIGFAAYRKDTLTGIYTLSFLANGSGTASGVRTTTLINNTDPNTLYDSGIGNGYLYLRDSLGTLRSLSLAGVTVVKTGAAAYSQVPISSVYELAYAVTSGYRVTVTLVENVSGSTHSVGGGAIYVTAIS